MLAWDWFNGGGNQAAWNTVLDSMLNGNAAASTWTAPVAEPKDPITATTTAGERMYTVSPLGCGDDSFLFRVDPGTALAAPIGDSLEGYASQGAWDATTGTAYVPFYSYDSGDYELLTVDLGTGAFSLVGVLEIDGDDYLDDVGSLAIGTDGVGYLLAYYYDDSEDDYFLGLFEVDLQDASLTHVADVDYSDLSYPGGFAVDPTTGLFYAFDAESWELFRVNVTTGALTALGVLDAPSLEEDSDVTSLQIGSDGTFWVVFEVDTGDVWAGFLARFELSDISGGSIPVTEIDVIVDDPIESYSLLITWSATLAATGFETGAIIPVALLLLLVGSVAVVVVRVRRSRTA